MNTELDVKLLQELDSVECDLRGLETRLTRLREMIYKDIGGTRSPYGFDGYPRIKDVVSEK